MSTSNDNFRDLYKVDTIKQTAISEFQESSSIVGRKDVRKYMYQVMATIGMELERKFSNLISFDNKEFKLFGREKSEKSISDKKKHNIDDYIKNFEKVIQSGNIELLPTQVRPIFDLYAFKLVCPEIKDPRYVIKTVLLDVLADISANHPEYRQIISEIKDTTDVSYFIVVDFIDHNFSDEYPELKNKILTTINQQHKANDIKEILENLSYDISTLTYSDYYSRIIQCYQILIDLSYDESYEEYVSLADFGLQARHEYEELLQSGESEDIIDKELQEDFDDRLQGLLSHISRKRTNKLDLSLCDLMMLDILTTSNKLKELGVSLSKDPTRTKKKRNPNGYVADFFSLDMPNGLTSEIQLQSAYRYNYGESGPAAHNKMGNGEKKRTLYKRPKDKSKYADWAKMQFKALPKYFRYIGHGFVQVYGTLDNFRRYYDTEKKEDVQTYASYIAEHDIGQFDSNILHFSQNDKSTLKSKEETR